MKKILAVILAVALVATLSISAVMTVSAGDPAKIVVSEATVTKGSTTSITIKLVNNPGLASMKLKVAFPEGITMNSPVDYTITAAGGQATQPQKFTSPVTLNWVSPFADVTGDQTFATLSFTVASDATEGDKEIAVTYAQEDVYNLAEDDVVYDIVNGKITVVSCLHANTTDVAAVASTCKTAGHGAYTKCTDCGAIISGSDETLDLDSSNHEGGTEVRNAKPATCSELGYTGDTVCLGCGATLAEGKEIAMTAHTAGDWQYSSDAHWKECTVCKQVIGESEPHDFEQVVIKEATTEEEGSKGEVCKVCGYVDKETVVTIPKLISYEAEQTAGKTEESAAVYDAKDAKEVGFTAKFGKNKLTAVKVNGQEVASDKYDVTEDGQGNVVVTFKDDYLKTLENGNYTVTVVADDGIAQSAFTVKNNAAGTTPGAPSSSKTGDVNVAVLVFSLLAIMGASIFAGVSYRRKNMGK